MRYVLAPALAMVLACSSGSAVKTEFPRPYENTEAAWKVLLSRMPQRSDELVREVEAFREKYGLPLSFWAGSQAKQSQRNDHPCGEVVQAFVKAMPSPSDPVSQSEEVFELGPTGEIVQRWWIPVDLAVKGLVGQELLILGELGGVPGSQVDLAISPEGEYRVVPYSENAQSTPMTCPMPRGLPDSSYLGCWAVVDRSSGMERRIAYEGPCS